MVTPKPAPAAEGIEVEGAVEVERADHEAAEFSVDAIQNFFFGKEDEEAATTTL